jgi:hypothetical protein
MDAKIPHTIRVLDERWNLDLQLEQPPNDVWPLHQKAWHCWNLDQEWRHVPLSLCVYLVCEAS